MFIRYGPGGILPLLCPLFWQWESMRHIWTWRKHNVCISQIHLKKYTYNKSLLAVFIFIYFLNRCQLCLTHKYVFTDCYGIRKQYYRLRSRCIERNSTCPVTCYVSLARFWIGRTVDVSSHNQIHGVRYNWWRNCWNA